MKNLEIFYTAIQDKITSLELTISKTTNTNQELLIGTKIQWDIGRLERPIRCEGLYIEPISDTVSKVKCLYRNNQRCIIDLEVSTSMLQIQN